MSSAIAIIRLFVGWVLLWKGSSNFFAGRTRHRTVYLRRLLLRWRFSWALSKFVGGALMIGGLFTRLAAIALDSCGRCCDSDVPELTDCLTSGLPVIQGYPGASGIDSQKADLSLFRSLIQGDAAGQEAS